MLIPCSWPIGFVFELPSQLCQTLSPLPPSCVFQNSLPRGEEVLWRRGRRRGGRRTSEAGSRAGACEAGSWGAEGPLGSLRAASRDLQSSSPPPGCRADPCHCHASECPTAALGCQVRATILCPGCSDPLLASRDALASRLHPPMTCLLKPFTVLRLVHLQASPGSGCPLNHTTFSSHYLG